MSGFFSDLKYFVGYIIPYGTFQALYFGGLHTIIVPVVAFIIIPLLELVLPASERNLLPAQEEAKIKNKFFDLLLYSNVPVQFFLLFYMFWQIRYGSFLPWEKIGMVISMGISCGALGINVAHELGHRASAFERFLARSLLLSSLYMHFYIEHNRGHHKNVSTPSDPASARYGETIYGFLFRSVTGSFRSAWNLEALRLERAGHEKWSFRNEMIRFLLLEAGFCTAVLLIFGPVALAAFFGAALTGIVLLETVNYVEHYGLQRREQEPGIYEKVKPWHSWNSDHLLGRIMLYELSRHSDHHFRSTRKYQVLRHFDESPQLPLGYPGSMVLAYFPAFWFRVMNPRVKAVALAHAE